MRDIAAAWQSRLRPAERRALLGLCLCLVVAAAPIARTGTPAARGLAFGLFVACLLSYAGHAWWQRRVAQHPARLTRRIVARLDRTLAARLARAAELVEATPSDEPGVSRELAELHLSRIVERVPRETIEANAEKRAARFRSMATLLVLAGLGCVLVFPVPIVEGYNVLLSRKGVAPLSMQLVELGPVLVQPPAYLRSSAEAVEFDTDSAQPRGSVVTLSGIPLRTGLALVVTDGTREVPFVSDGRGGVTARYVLEASVRLRVAARFGNVLTFQRSALALEAIVDRPPAVELEGAPRKITLNDDADLGFHYRVTDDHGIRQIDLVLRAGPREERRQLVRLDGRTPAFEGAYVLDVGDAFLTNSYGSVEVRVAARDENTEEGAEWGQSEAIVVDKPSLGQLQVRRYEAYRDLRDRLVDWLASVTAKSKSAAEIEQRRSAAIERLSETERGAYNESYLRKVMGAFLRAQGDKLRRAPKDGVRLAALLEEVTLSVDSAVEAISHRDAAHVSRLLADVAAEIEAGAKAALSGEQREQGMHRVRVGLDMLGGGAAELKRIGRLGADLGEVAQAGWARIGHVAAARDYANVERAASFLAERLRRSTPSFVGGGRPGVESMRGSGGRGSRPKASDADTHLERVVAELEQLAREHASGIEAVERLVDDASRGIGPESLKEAAKLHANELRRLVEGLPPLGAEPGSLRAALGLGKELVHGSAESLERLNLAGAYDGLRKADSALNEAAQHHAASALDPAELKPSAVDELRRQLGTHREWVKAMLDEARQSSATKDRGALTQSAGHEREMAERTSRLARREAKSDAVLPEEVRSDLEQSARLMQQAAETLESGRVEVGLERQRDAQRLLERNLLGSDRERQETKQANRSERDARGGKTSGGGTVVSTSDTESREEFRRRVQQGLSRDVTPELSPVVRRYAEGLLK